MAAFKIPFKYFNMNGSSIRFCLLQKKGNFAVSTDIVNSNEALLIAPL